MAEYGEVVAVSDGIYGRVLDIYTNGYETTAGFAELNAEACGGMVSVTFDGEHCTELPFEWPKLLFLDDRDKRLRIKEIKYGNLRPYIMEDGHASGDVTL